MLCINTEYNYLGAVVRITVETISEEICNEVKSLSSKGYEDFTELLKKHKGCKIISENPLKIISGDETIVSVLEPVNFIAKAFWGEAIKRIKSECRSI